MMILNENLNGYKIAVTSEKIDIGAYVGVRLAKKDAADMAFSMSAERARELLERLKEALGDE